MPDVYEDLRDQARAIEDFFNRYAFDLDILQRGAEKIATAHLRRSEWEADRMATVTTHPYGNIHFKLLIQKPKVLVPARFRARDNPDVHRAWEIHGPKGNVRMTKDKSVVDKARKQGLHVELKTYFPRGKTPLGEGIYKGVKLTRRDTCFARVLDENRSACMEVLGDFDRYLERRLKAYYGSPESS